MKRAFGCARPLIVGVLLASCLITVSLASYWILRQRQDNVRAEFAPPVVNVSQPGFGASFPAGSYFTVSASVYYQPGAPAKQVELWMDGELKERQELTPAEDAAVSNLDFDLLLPSEGPHVLSVRAVNSLGVIGQSEPIGVYGTGKPQPAFYSIRVSADETLASIATTYGTDLATLQQLNPGLGGQAPAPATVLKVPVPSEQESPSPISQPPPVPGGGAVPSANASMLKVAGIPQAFADFNLFVARPPEVPAGLQAQVKDCKLILTWNDNATNETGYTVWLANATSPALLIAKLQPAPGGPVWFELPAPGNGSYSLWVEAVNPVGAQPSNIVAVTIAPQCPAAPATHLQIEILEMTLPARYDRAYCYISFVNAPEVRLPAQDGTFVEVQAGQGNIAAWPHAFAVPIPANNALDIRGECWGWSGASLEKLGVFSNLSAQETWDGFTHVISVGSSQISLAIQPAGALKDTYADKSPGAPGPGGGGDWIPDAVYPIDPSLPAPFDLKQERLGSPAGLEDPQDEYLWFWQRSLDWKWNGDPKQITGFVIYLNGVPYKAISDASQRGSWVKLPGYCGGDLHWQVAAVAYPYRSNLSAPIDEFLPTCQTQAYVRVQFISIELFCTADGMASCMTRYAPWWASLCQTLDTYFQLSVNGMTRSFWGGNNFMPLKCGQHFFGDITGLPGVLPDGSEYDPGTFVIPIYTDYVEINIKTKFWDYDDVGADDPYGLHSETYWFPSLENALTSLEINSATRFGYGDCVLPQYSVTSLTQTAESRLTYTIEVFPNACQETP
jgi:hypothetical protein